MRQKSILALAAAVAAIGAFVPATEATPVTINNPGFEIPTLPAGAVNSGANNGGYANGAVPGWNKAGTAITSTYIYNVPSSTGAVYSGNNNYLDLAEPATATPASYVNVTQALNGTTTADGFTNQAITVQPLTTYTFSLDIGTNVANYFPGGYGNTIYLDNSDPTSNSTSYQFQARLVPTGYTGFGNQPGVTMTSSAFVVPSNAASTVTPVSFTYTTGTATQLGSLVGTDLYIQLYLGGVGSGTFESVYPDNIALDVSSIAVPEPASLSVLGIGALSLLRRRIRRS